MKRGSSQSKNSPTSDCQRSSSTPSENTSPSGMPSQDPRTACQSTDASTFETIWRLLQQHLSSSGLIPAGSTLQQGSEFLVSDSGVRFHLIHEQSTTEI